jgi:hypothetical protein
VSGRFLERAAKRFTRVTGGLRWIDEHQMHVIRFRRERRQVSIKIPAEIAEDDLHASNVRF